MRDDHSNTRYHVLGRRHFDDAGKPGAEKFARRVWRGALEKGQVHSSSGAYPTTVLYKPIEIQVGIQITIKLRAMLSTNGWEYYRWVDSFLERIENEISREAFFNRIQWESVVSLLECLMHSPHLSQQYDQQDKNNLAAKTAQKDMEQPKPTLDTTHN
jgi:hypothetical protein